MHKIYKCYGSFNCNMVKEIIIESVTEDQTDILVQDLNSIKGIRAGTYFQKNLLGQEDLVVKVGIDIVEGVGIGLIIFYFTKFLDNNKSKNNRPIIINYNNIIATQGEVNIKQNVESISGALLVNIGEEEDVKKKTTKK